MAAAREDLNPSGWTRRPWTEARRLRDELRVTRARLAALEEERADLLRRDRRAGVLTLDAFREAASAALRRSQRRGEPAALILTDIDGFRALNGRRGAAVGDQALAAVGARMRDLARPGDVIGRIGADEFALVMPGTDASTARVVAERLVGLMEADGPVTVSVGYAADPGAGGLDAVLADAADVLQRARRAGGGRVGMPGRPGPDHDEPARGAVGALALAVAERDRASADHNERVVALASAVATRLGLRGEDVERIVAAALLHGVGTVAVPDTILTKREPLTDDEWRILRERPVVGERILRAVPGLGPVARIVRHVHERYDGRGYPDGVRGDDIPLGSRIVTACDAYDTMISPRPYREALTHDAALAELEAGSGTQFDPRVARALIAYLRDCGPGAASEQVPQRAAV